MSICFLCNTTFDGEKIEKHECQPNSCVYFCPKPGCFYSSPHSFRVKLHNSAIHFKFKKFACSVKGCKFRAAQKSDLTKHMLKHSNERPHQCHCCDKTFKAKEAYFTHMRVMHYSEYAKMKPLECACGKRYKFQSNLCRHLVMCNQSQLQI